jgi:hypothetical protein
VNSYYAALLAERNLPLRFKLRFGSPIGRPTDKSPFRAAGMGQIIPVPLAPPFGIIGVNHIVAFGAFHVAITEENVGMVVMAI